MTARRSAVFAQAALSGLLVALSFPLGAPLPWGDHPGWWPLGWVALAPLMIAAASSRTRTTAAIGGLICGVTSHALILAWMIPFLGRWGMLPWPIAWVVFLLLVVYLACFQAVWAFCVRVWCDRLGEAAACAIAPAAWAGLEWVRAHLFGGFPWSPLGASQHSQPQALQIADLTGVYGVSFALACGSGAIAILFRRRAMSRGSAAVVAAVLVGCIGGTWVYGIVRDRDDAGGGADDAPPIEVALIQANVPQPEKWDPDERARIEQVHLDLTRRAAAGGARLIVWSESSVPRSVTADPDYEALLARLAAETGAEILVGSVAYATEAGVRVPYNRAFLVRPGAGVTGRYDKQRLVPFGEYVPMARVLGFLESVVAEASDFRAGPARAPLPSGGATIGPLICYEAIFPSLARRGVRQGADLLVNITNDAWYAGTAMPRQHLALSAVRAVELRRTLLRCANTGISAIVDPRGRTVARTEEDETAILRGRVTPSTEVSAYAAVGDVFAAACAILALLAAAHAIARPRDPRGTP